MHITSDCCRPLAAATDKTTLISIISTACAVPKKVIKMGNSPSTGCHITGCPHLSIEHSGFCEEHLRERRRDADKKRGTAVERGYDYRWQQQSKIFLRHHPLCVECSKENKVTPANCVDHIEPHKGNQSLFWDKNNWQPLCKHHHDLKTAKENLKNKK